MWKRALRTRKCPYDGCDLRLATCQHLDNYLQFGRHYFERQVNIRFTDQIERFSEMGESREGEVWALFRKLRSLGLANDQVSLLLRKFVYGMTRKQIMADMGWTSNRAFDDRLAQAMQALKDRGFKKGDN
jgi:hypothetical protein